MASSFQQRRTEFGSTLRELRQAAGLTAKQLATDIGWDAPKLSKIETAKQTATEDDLTALITGLALPTETAKALRADLAAIWSEYASWKQQMKAGHRPRQERAAEVEAQAKVIRAVDIGAIPGLLQTADYARYVLLSHATMHGGDQDITEAVRARMRRQQILYETGRSLEFLVAEYALLHPVAPREVMAGQIHRLIATIGTPNVRFGILPARTRLPYALDHGFWIVDNIVQVELISGELPITDPDEVAIYNKLTDLLWPVAAEGDDARELLSRILGEYTDQT